MAGWKEGCFDHLHQEQGTIGAADGGVDGAHMVPATPGGAC